METIATPPATRSARKAATAVIAIMAMITILQGLGFYLNESEDAASLLGGAAKTLDYQIDRTFRALDAVLADAADRIDPSVWPDPTFTPWLRGRLSAFPEVNNILVLGLDGQSIGGRISATGEVRTTTIELSDREYFRYHRDHPTDRAMHIGEPSFKQADGRATIPVSRAIFDRQGKMIAIVRLAVSSTAMIEGLAAGLVDTDGSNALVSNNGVILARAPGEETFVGKSVRDGRLFRDALPAARIGIGEFVSPLDGMRRILAYRALEHYPLVVVAGRPKTAIYATWRRQQYLTFGVFGVLATALYWAAARSDRREQQRALLAESKIAAELRATRAHQQMADAIESLDDAVALYDVDERLIACNTAYLAMFGEAHDTIRPGMSLEEIFRIAQDHGCLDLDRPDFETWLAVRRTRHRQATGGRFVLQCRNNRWVQQRECRTAQGGVIAVQSDITALKLREAELERLRRRYQLILDSAGDGIIGIDPEGCVTFANHAATALLGYEPAEMSGRPLHRFVRYSDDWNDLANWPVAAAYRQGLTQRIDGEAFWRSDGQSFPADYLIAPMFEDGTVSGAVLVFRDATMRLRYERSLADIQHELARKVAERTAELRREIAGRIQSEAALRASRERLKRMSDSLFHGLVVVDQAGHVAFINPSARRLLECDAIGGDVEGYPLDHLVRLRGRNGDLGFTGSPWQRVISDGLTLQDDDAVFVTASGKARAVAYACSPISDDEGHRSAIVSFRDIEEVKAAQREALQASRLASVGQLAAGIAHEINTPIQYIGDNLRFVADTLSSLPAILDIGRDLATQAAPHSGLAAAVSRFENALADADLPEVAEEAQAAVRESLDGVAQVARIVMSMKEFSHPGCHVKAMTDINRALETTLTVCRNVWKHVATVETDFSPSLPPVLCHAGEMNQVFLNLIVNAAHAIEASGKASPGLIRVSTSHDDETVVIRVADSGTGVPEAIKDRVFDPFFTTKEVGKGTGQGLAICRDVVVTKHGGTIAIDGREGEGAMFIIRLPIEGSGSAAD